MDTLKEQMDAKKVEMFDLQILIGTLQAQLQTKANELNVLILKQKNEQM